MGATATLLVVAIVALTVAGCASSVRRDGIPATNLSAMAIGVDRATVEDVLGSPIASAETQTGRKDTYRYDKGLAPKPSSGSPRATGIFTHPGVLLLVLLGAAITQPFRDHNVYEEQKGELTITYGPDDKVVRVENEEQRASRELEEELSLIQVGATREQVVDVLGEPDDSEIGEGGMIDVYGDQRGKMTNVVYVTYGPDGTVAHVETAAQRRALHQEELRDALTVVRVGATREQVDDVLGEPDYGESEGDRTVQVYRHRRGSAHVVMYVIYGPDDTVTRAETAAERRAEDKRRDTEDLLAKANCGDAQAQHALGFRYMKGLGVAQDIARAYFWYGIAYSDGVGGSPRNTPNLSERLTPEQIAETERLIAEWQPEECAAAASMVTTEQVIENQ